MPSPHPPPMGQRTHETSGSMWRPEGKPHRRGENLTPSADISTCAPIMDRARLPTARLGRLHVPDTLLAPAALPGTGGHATPSQGFADPSGSAHRLAARDPPALLTLCSLAMKSHRLARGNFRAGKISPASETQRSSHCSGSDLIIKRCRGHCSQPAP